MRVRGHQGTLSGGAARLAGGCLLAVTAGAPGAAVAQEAQTGMFVSAGLSAETNPYNEPNTSGAALAATAEVHPRAELRDATTVLDLDAYAQFRQFFRRYGLEDNYGASARMQSRRSDRVTLRANAQIDYSEGGYSGFGRPSLAATAPPIYSVAPGSVTDPTLPTAPTGPIDTATPPLALDTPLPTPIDVTILGSRTRTTSYGSGLGIDTQLSARSQLSADVNASALRYASLGFADYNNYGAEFRYSHTLSALTSVGLIGDFGWTDYLASRVGDATTAAALVSLDRRFSQRWALSLAAGASFTNIRQLPGQPDAHLTAFNIRGRFCRQGERSQLCISGQRSPQPAANGNVRISNSFEVDYSLRLSERERITLTGAYTRTGRGRGVAASLPAVDFVSAAARYDRQLTERTTFFTSASFGKIYSDFAPRRANLGIAAGLQFRFGALK